MVLEELKNKRVGILGYGREGKSVARYLDRHGIKPVLFDKSRELEAGKFDAFTGEGYLDHLSEVEVLFRSPGFWRLEPKLVEFGKNGGLITSQTIWFFENCPADIIGVTGTKGKGTTTTLAYELAKANGKKAYLTGNIGLDDPLDFLDRVEASDLVYFELSSFQLQDLKISPHIGVVLMVTADHLDHHQDITEYHKAKTAIVKYQKDSDFAIINKDFPASLSMSQEGKGQKLWVSSTKVSFGIQITNGELWAFGLDRFGIGKEKFLLRLDELTLRGEHNLQNVSAALLTGIVQGFDMDSMLATAKTFKGLEHRLEFVTERRGVKFYNDSYSTTPDTAIAAVKSFSEPTYLILGGSEKFLDYSGLAAVLAKRTNLKGIFLIGQTGPRINEALIAAKFPAEKIMTSPKNLEEIFSRLQLLVEEGDVVLLSPATASFDMFPNYKERGNQFKQLSQRF
jgi:UDP-N-acetylmuramoylalanine--D-glutamate ligase